MGAVSRVGSVGRRGVDCFDAQLISTVVVRLISFVSHCRDEVHGPAFLMPSPRGDSRFQTRRMTANLY